ncbi:MAG: hypothetical protein JWM21_1311 [Acidobacteria bacterium]|nr:hypothetical protein [Acidobacteriota bacterium]
MNGRGLILFDEVMQQLHGTNHAPGMVATPMVGETSKLAPHLLSLEAGEWAMWKESALRSAGFPAAEVLKLATPEFAAAVDHYLDAERELEAAKNVALADINAAFDEIRREGLWKDRTRRAPLHALLTRLKAGRAVEFDESSALAAAFANYNQSLTRVESFLDNQAREFQIAQLRVSHALNEVASSPRFHEAVIWQNHAAWNRGIKNQLLEPINSSKRSYKQRQHEELIAMYLQRYCTKNDTIGFFGPVGWAQFVPEGEALEVRPGRELLAARNVYIESWCIDEVAETIGREPSLRPWLAPRRMPFVGLVDGSVQLPGGASLKLTAKEAAILAACDGQRTAKDLAATLINQGLGIKSEAEVYQCLDTYCKRGLLVWKLEVPISQWAMDSLRGLLERVGDERVRREALAVLDKFEAGRQRIIAAAGDPEQLDVALTGFEDEFRRFTGLAPNRAAGQTYGGRTLIYEDCRRNLEAKVGPAVLEALAPPLSLLLRSGRWLSYEVAELYRAALRPVYEELVQKTGSRVVSAVDFWIKCDRFFFKEDTHLAENILPRFQQRWAEVLQLSPEARRVEFTYEQLRPQVERAFAAPHPGWSHARYQSPDVMIAASSVEAIRRNEFQLTIGEVHLGVNCVNSGLFFAQHPRMEELHEATISDFARTRLIPVTPKNWPKVTARTYFEFVSPRNYQLLISPDACGGEPSRTVPISDVVVEERDGQLLLRTIDERWQFEIIEGFGEFLSGLIMNFFHPLPPQRHTPRITIDRLTVARETWRFGAAELTFAFEKDEVQRFVGARRWKHEFDLPRFVFIKAPVEQKPLYLDLESPTLINIFARIVRRTKEANAPNMAISVTEMYPAHDQLWLPDAQGNLYTNEFRLVVLDQSLEN